VDFDPVSCAKEDLKPLVSWLARYERDENFRSSVEPWEHIAVVSRIKAIKTYLRLSKSGRIKTPLSPSQVNHRIARIEKESRITAMKARPHWSF